MELTRDNADDIFKAITAYDVHPLDYCIRIMHLIDVAISANVWLNTGNEITRNTLKNSLKSLEKALGA